VKGAPRGTTSQAKPWEEIPLEGGAALEQVMFQRVAGRSNSGGDAQLAID
jgi:hypothetical protein